jgi:hypothetical protein
MDRLAFLPFLSDAARIARLVFQAVRYECETRP